MKRLLQLSAALLPILSGACASLPGVPSVELPTPPPVQVSLPPPAICLQDPQTVQSSPPPTLPPEAPAPAGNPRDTVSWWRSAAEYFQARAIRAEIASVYATNRADEVIRVAEDNAAVQVACAEQLIARQSEGR